MVAKRASSKEVPWTKVVLSILSALIIAGVVAVATQVLANTTDLAVHGEVLSRIEKKLDQVIEKLDR